MEFIRKARTAMRFYFALKKEIFSSSDLARYKKSQIYTRLLRLALTLSFGIYLLLDGRGTVRAFEINQF
jgi:hypothetical protein